MSFEHDGIFSLAVDHSLQRRFLREGSDTCPRTNRMTAVTEAGAASSKAGSTADSAGAGQRVLGPPRCGFLGSQG